VRIRERGLLPSIFAFGNSSGDLAMLEVTTASGLPNIHNIYEQYRMLPKLAKNLKFEDITIEAFIIYDESSSPSAADYLIVADYPIEIYL
jgi:hypothetical protein